MIKIKCSTCGKLHRYKKDKYIVKNNNVFCDVECKDEYYKKRFDRSKTNG